MLATGLNTVWHSNLSFPTMYSNWPRGNLLATSIAALLLSESRRGTLIDDLVVFCSSSLAHCGEMGCTPSADWRGCLTMRLGALPFKLRILRGQDLLDKLRLDYRVGAAAGHAAISKTFGAFGIDVIDPYLSASVAEVAERIPLDMRVDRKRLMKPVLRYAFRNDLPDVVVRRHKRVSRDVSGVKMLMAERYGISRERFLPQFDAIFRAQGAGEIQRTLLGVCRKKKTDPE